MSDEFCKGPVAKMLLPAIIILGAALRVYRLGSQSLWFDELYAVWANRLPVGELVREHLAAGHPPFYYLEMKSWFAVSTDETWIRLFSVLAGVATIWFVYLAGKELYTRQAGLWGAAFVAVSPLLVWYSRAATFYSFMIFLTTLSFYMLVRCSLRGGWLNWAGYTTAAAAVFFTYFFAGVMMAAAAAVFLLLHDRGRGQLVPWLVSTGMLAVAAAGSYIASRQAISETSSSMHFPGADELMRLIYGIALAPFVLFAGPLDDAINYRGTEGAPVSHLLALLAFGAGVAAAISLSPHARRWFASRETLAVFAFVLILVAGPLALRIANQGLLSGRFYVWAAPALLLLAGAAVAAMTGWRQAAAGIVILSGLLVLSAATIMGLPDRDADWRSLMGVISQQRQPDDRMLCFPLHNCVIAAGYYLSGNVPVSGGMPDQAGNGIYFLPPGAEWTGYRSGYWAGTGASPPLAGRELVARLNQELAGADRIWLITTEDFFQKNPAAGMVLSNGWKEAGTWDYGYSVLRLYERSG